MDGFEVIHSYSRAQALADGVLVDVSEAAKKVGIRYPVAVTGTLYERYITVPTNLSESEQSASARLHDVLFVLVLNVKKSQKTGNEVHFSVGFRMSETESEVAQLWALLNGGDSGEPVITIMLEGED